MCAILESIGAAYAAVVFQGENAEFPADYEVASKVVSEVLGTYLALGTCSDAHFNPAVTTGRDKQAGLAELSCTSVLGFVILNRHAPRNMLAAASSMALPWASSWWRINMAQATIQEAASIQLWRLESMPPAQASALVGASCTPFLSSSEPRVQQWSFKCAAQRKRKRMSNAQQTTELLACFRCRSVATVEGPLSEYFSLATGSCATAGGYVFEVLQFQTQLYCTACGFLQSTASQ